jgi:hypothetical protein
VLSQPERIDSRDLDRERIANARRTAEALFRPKLQPSKETVLIARAPDARQPRKPRIQPISPAVPVRGAAAKTRQRQATANAEDPRVAIRLRSLLAR